MESQPQNAEFGRLLASDLFKLAKVLRFEFLKFRILETYWETIKYFNFILFKNIIFSLFQESLKKFREQRDKLEQSESLKQVRKKFVSTEPILHV